MSPIDMADLVKLAGIWSSEVMILDYDKDGFVEKWILLSNSNFRTIWNHLGEGKIIWSPARAREPHYSVRITQKEVAIEYFWTREDKNVISLTNQDVRKIQDNLGKTGKLLFLDCDTPGDRRANQQ